MHHELRRRPRLYQAHWELLDRGDAPVLAPARSAVAASSSRPPRRLRPPGRGGARLPLRLAPRRAAFGRCSVPIGPAGDAPLADAGRLILGGESFTFAREPGATSCRVRTRSSIVARGPCARSAASRRGGRPRGRDRARGRRATSPLRRRCQRSRLERARASAAEGSRWRKARRASSCAAATRRSSTGSTNERRRAASTPSIRSSSEVTRVLRGPPRRHRALAAAPPLLLRLPDAHPARARAAGRARARPRLRAPATCSRRSSRRAASASTSRRPRSGPRASATAASGSSFFEGDAADPDVLAQRRRALRHDPARQRGHAPDGRAGDARGAARGEPPAHPRADLQLQPALAAAAAARRAHGHEAPAAARGVAAAGGDQDDARARGLRGRARRRAHRVPRRIPLVADLAEPLPGPAAARRRASR